MSNEELSFGQYCELFSLETRRTILYAADEAARARRCNYISTEHLLIGLLRVENNIAYRALQEKGLSADQIIKELHWQMGPIGDALYKQIELTPNAKGVILCAFDEAQKAGRTTIREDDLLLGFLQHLGLAGRVLDELGVDADYVREFLRRL